MIAPSFLEKLPLLQQRFPDGVLVPEAVWREVVEEGRGRPGTAELRSADWIVVANVVDAKLTRLLRAKLDEGERKPLCCAVSVSSGTCCWMRKTRGRRQGHWAWSRWAQSAF